MGRVRTKTVKKSSRQVIERYYSKMTLDFHTNKKKGPVHGISLKLQEEERERCMDFVPDESAIKTDVIEVDKETHDMLTALGMADLPGVIMQTIEPQALPTAPAYGRGGAGGFGRRY
ncbi:40S ribosomal S17 [Olea europaea subsp. europaea]|uniref:40S ribosomal S17 n=1 Tax=Olea europaea subsp. europaea TaxID=158383 RepID=A0A8S0SCA7_OLEEU|nr:40S ribosomal S17 [Olea europaea subsp. europaea]